MAAMTLKQIEEKVRSHVITPAEKRAQRVSLAVGLQPYKSALTREEISSLMGEIEGHDGATPNIR